MFEVENGFIVNDFGKYRPGLTFLLPKEFLLDGEGRPVYPFVFYTDREVTGNMNVDFDGEVSFMFGDFFCSKKGGACFKVKNPAQAQHLLVKDSWGGAFSRTRGMDGAPDEALYYRRATSNGGGCGVDWLVVPVGFKNIIRMDEFEFDTPTSHAHADSERASAIKTKYEAIRNEREASFEAAFEAKHAAEIASAAAKPEFVDRLLAVNSMLEEEGLYDDKVELGDRNSYNKNYKSHWNLIIVVQ